MGIIIEQEQKNQEKERNRGLTRVLVTARSHPDKLNQTQVIARA